MAWRRIDLAAIEHCTLTEAQDGWTLEGTIVTQFEGEPSQAEYRVACDKPWRTRAVEVELRVGGSKRGLRLEVDDLQRWYAAGMEVDSLRGCLDVDLEGTSATNTLPIRRLKLEVGQSGTVVAAWVRFPGLTIELLPQRYTRHGPSTYSYESAGGSFLTSLEVDDQGLVTRYGTRWERTA